MAETSTAHHLGPPNADCTAADPGLDALSFDFNDIDFDFDSDFDFNLDSLAAGPESGDSSTSAGVDNPTRTELESGAGGLKRKSSGGSGGGSDEEGRRRARLMRNRESAQLSRQRRKQYVEELEDKVKSMSSTIAELRGQLSFSVAENTNLRYQLFAAGTAGVAYPPAPWYPPVFGPPGSHVPLLPIPRIRPQNPSPAVKVKKKSTKTKKVASVSLLGLLFFILLFGGLVPLFNNRYESSVNSLSKLNHGNDWSQGRVLTVREPMGNASEALSVSLYVPRNDRLVKIDGNLIINSVLASGKSEVRGGDCTGLVVHGDYGDMGSALALSDEGQRYMGRFEEFREQNFDPKELTASKRHFQQLFREGLAGPIMSSSMCTEVFRFEASGNPGAIGSATSLVNATHSNPGLPSPKRVKNRRILYSPPHLPSLPHNKTSESPPEPLNEGKPSGNSSASSPMVVSVLLDPRDADDDAEKMVSPNSKSLSRIFVVVLLDSVKYVTYSCVLPIKGSVPHFVSY